MKNELRVIQVVGGLPSEKFPSLQPFVASQIDSLGKKGVIIDTLDLSVLHRSGLKKYLYGAWGFRRLMTSRHYDIVHAHYSYCGVIAKLQITIPVIVSLMGNDLLGTPNPGGQQTLKGLVDIAITKQLAKKADYIIVKSDEMKKHLMPNVRASVIPNGVDFDLFKPMEQNEARDYFDIPRDQKVVLFAANPDEARKNYSLAKEAVEMLNVGHGHNSFLWAFYKRSQKELPIAMNAADVLIMTSYWEGSPNIVKEAMACNLPIVSVRVGDVPLIISGSTNCYLADYSGKDLAAALNRVITIRERSNGRQNINHLRLEVVADRIIEIYQGVLATHPRKRQY